MLRWRVFINTESLFLVELEGLIIFEHCEHYPRHFKSTAEKFHTLFLSKQEKMKADFSAVVTQQTGQSLDLLNQVPAIQKKRGRSGLFVFEYCHVYLYK
eukprot:m.86875 g.86875  ORF g.86875 m.86875 type:complete len:99 (+) comp14484_c0_seq5:486-782(+)